MGGGPVRVAVVITRLEGGAGILALRGAPALDPARFQMTVITGSGTALIARARAAGLEVVVEPSLRTPIAPVADLTALRRLSALLRQRRFDVVHTHTAKAGAVGRLAARRAGAAGSSTPITGFLFTSSSRRPAGVRTWRWNGGWAGSPTWRCASGAGWRWRRSGAASSRPDRIRTIGVAVDAPLAVAADTAVRASAPAGYLACPNTQRWWGQLGGWPTRRRRRTFLPPCARCAVPAWSASGWAGASSPGGWPAWPPRSRQRSGAARRRAR